MPYFHYIPFPSHWTAGPRVTWLLLHRQCGFKGVQDGEEADLFPGPELSFQRPPHGPGRWMPSGPFRGLQRSRALEEGGWGKKPNKDLRSQGARTPYALLHPRGTPHPAPAPVRRQRACAGRSSLPPCCGPSFHPGNRGATTARALAGRGPGGAGGAGADRAEAAAVAAAGGLGVSGFSASAHGSSTRFRAQRT